MSEKQVQQIMRSLADEKAPEETINLWPAIKSWVESSGRKPRQSGHSRFRLAGAALIMALLLAGAVFLITPQGQAWAQNAFQFFNETEGNRIPLEDFKATRSALSSGSASQSTPTAENSEPTEQVSQILDNLTFDEVQALVDYEIVQPTWLPDKYEFGRALYDQERNIVNLMYYYGGNPHAAVGLRLEPVSDSGACSLCQIVGSSGHVEEVSINGVYGEYVVGAWILEDGEAIWKNFSYYRQMKHLTWQADGMTYNLTSYENTHLLKQDLVAVAESIPTGE